MSRCRECDSFKILFAPSESFPEGIGECLKYNFIVNYESFNQLRKLECVGQRLSDAIGCERCLYANRPKNLDPCKRCEGIK